jgi:SRSO17 transposase
MNWNDRLWQQSQPQLARFMIPLVTVLGRSERRVAATRYVTGLLLPGQRKSIAPMSERLGVDAQSLQQFVSDSPWEEQSLWSAIRQEIIPRLGPMEAWVVDETGWVKQGDHSVGVAHQYCGSVGKQANCQVSVELVVSDGTVAGPRGRSIVFAAAVARRAAMMCGGRRAPGGGLCHQTPNRHRFNGSHLERWG